MELNKYELEKAIKEKFSVRYSYLHYAAIVLVFILYPDLLGPGSPFFGLHLNLAGILAFVALIAALNYVRKKTGDRPSVTVAITAFFLLLFYPVIFDSIIGFSFANILLSKGLETLTYVDLVLVAGAAYFFTVAFFRLVTAGDSIFTDKQIVISHDTIGLEKIAAVALLVVTAVILNAALPVNLREIFKAGIIIGAADFMNSLLARFEHLNRKPAFLFAVFVVSLLFSMVVAAPFFGEDKELVELRESLKNSEDRSYDVMEKIVSEKNFTLCYSLSNEGFSKIDLPSPSNSYCGLVEVASTNNSALCENVRFVYKDYCNGIMALKSGDYQYAGHAFSRDELDFGAEYLFTDCGSGICNILKAVLQGTPATEFCKGYSERQVISFYSAYRPDLESADIQELYERFGNLIETQLEAQEDSCNLLYSAFSKMPTLGCLRLGRGPERPSHPAQIGGVRQSTEE